jgi:Saxitoxin biosynthesis operon protein SxtJ
MKPSFHEDFSRAEEVKASTDRGFGLTVGGILLLIAAVRTYLHGFGWLQPTLGVIGLALIALGLIAPRSLSGLNRAWTKLGLILFRIVNPVVLGLVYFVVVVPLGLLIRVSRRDPLNLKFDPRADSYWVLREPPGPTPETMINQF